MCHEAGIPHIEQDLTEADVREADEVFLSSSLRDVAPVTRIDGQPVGGGKAGQTTLRVMELYQDFCRRRLAEVYRPELERLLAG